MVQAAGCGGPAGTGLHLPNERPGATWSRDRIDQRSIEAGIGLSDWFGNEARRVYALLRETKEQREERELVAWIAQRGGRATVRDIERGPRQFRGEVAAIEKAIARLVKRRRGRWVHGRRDGPGRPASIFELLPGGDGDENGDSQRKSAIVSPSPTSNTENGPPPPDDADSVNRLLADAADEEEGSA